MDHIDRQILALLQENARMPLKMLAEQVFLSAPAVSARIEKLESQGILVGYHAQTDPKQLGYSLTASIGIEPAARQQGALLSYLRVCSNVTECCLTTGACSVMVRAVFSDTQELEKFLESLQFYGTASAQIILSVPIPLRGINTEYDAK